MGSPNQAIPLNHKKKKQKEKKAAFFGKYKGNKPGNGYVRKQLSTDMDIASLCVFFYVFGSFWEKHIYMYSICKEDIWEGEIGIRSMEIGFRTKYLSRFH